MKTKSAQAISKISMMMESMVPVESHSDNVIFHKKWGNKTYGIVREKQGFVIKESLGGIKESDFTYINGLPNMGKYTRPTYQDALGRLSIILSESSATNGSTLQENLKTTLDEDKFVLKAPAPSAPAADPNAEVPVPDESPEGLEDTEEQPEFMSKYGELIEDFKSAEPSDKKWLMMTLVAALDPQGDTEVVDAIKGKLDEVGQEQPDADTDVDAGDGGGFDDGLGESTIVESLSKKAFMSKYKPFGEKPKANAPKGLVKQKKVSTTGTPEKDTAYSGTKDPNETKKGIFEIFDIKPKMSDKSQKGSAKSVKTPYEGTKPPNEGTAFPQKPTKSKTVKEGKESAPFTDTITGTDVYATASVDGEGIERYGQEKKIFDDAKAKSLTAPKGKSEKVESREKSPIKKGGGTSPKADAPKSAPVAEPKTQEPKETKEKEESGESFGGKSSGIKPMQSMGVMRSSILEAAGIDLEDLLS